MVVGRTQEASITIASFNLVVRAKTRAPVTAREDQGLAPSSADGLTLIAWVKRHRLDRASTAPSEGVG